MVETLTLSPASAQRVDAEMKIEALKQLMVGNLINVMPDDRAKRLVFEIDELIKQHIRRFDALFGEAFSNGK